MANTIPLTPSPQRARERAHTHTHTHTHAHSLTHSLSLSPHQSLGQEDPLEKAMATHSSILPWRIHGQRSLVGYSSVVWGLPV